MMKKYSLIESDIEIPLRYIKDGILKEGMTLEDPEPYEISTYSTSEEAVEILRKKHPHSKIDIYHTAVPYAHITEWYVDESEVDEDGEFTGGGDILEFSKMPEMKVVK